MKRELKFRAWHKGYSNKKCNIEPQMILAEKASDPLQWLEQGQPVVVMQFTGLKDKNEVEIYEGDIVKSAYGNNKDKVVFKNGCFCCFGEPMGFQEEDHVIIESRVDQWAIVIGNIYQNPELLP